METKTKHRFEAVYSRPHHIIVDYETNDEHGYLLQYKYYNIGSKKIANELADLLNYLNEK